jgi:hypothetical protein
VACLGSVVTLRRDNAGGVDGRAAVAARLRGLLGSMGFLAIRARDGLGRATPGHASEGRCRWQDLPLPCYGRGCDFGTGKSRSDDHLADLRWDLPDPTCSSMEALWPGTRHTDATLVLGRSHSAVQSD